MFTLIVLLSLLGIFILAWFLAKLDRYVTGKNTNNWMVWRVTYPDGKQTRPLYYREACGLANCFNGKLWKDKSEIENIKNYHKNYYSESNLKKGNAI